MKRTTTILALAAFALVATRARASTIFPGEIQTHLGLQSAPVCTICHQTMSGGIGTATKPFARTLRSKGLVAGDTNALDAALDADAAANIDSDGDCVSDIAELKKGTDPSNPDDNPGACGDGGAGEGGVAPPSSGSNVEDPAYGCRAAPTRGGAGAGAATWAALAAAGALALRARRRGRPRPAGPRRR